MKELSRSIALFHYEPVLIGSGFKKIVDGMKERNLVGIVRADSFMLQGEIFCRRGKGCLFLHHTVLKSLVSFARGEGVGIASVNHLQRRGGSLENTPDGISFLGDGSLMIHLENVVLDKKGKIEL